MSYAYRLKRLHGGSARYGNCECCGQPVDTSYMMVQMRRYKCDDTNEGITYNGCFSKVGHKECLTGLTNS